MSRNLKNTIALFVLLLLVSGFGGIYSFVIQSKKISVNEKRLDELKQFSKNRDALLREVSPLKSEVTKLDSLLNKMEYNIPTNLSQYDFYDFVIKKTANFSSNSHVNVTFLQKKDLKDFSYYEYLISGDAYYNDLYNLIFSIENSRAIKQVSNVSLSGAIIVDEEGIPRYLVNFKFNVRVFSSSSNRFVASDFYEKELVAPKLYDMFYPLIRDKIIPNLEHNLDVHTAKLLAVLPNGAYLTDASQQTFLLNKGDKVYLGYLTSINREDDEVDFVINNGGIVEYVTLTLKNEEKNEQKK